MLWAILIVAILALLVAMAAEAHARRGYEMSLRLFQEVSRARTAAEEVSYLIASMQREISRLGRSDDF